MDGWLDRNLVALLVLLVPVAGFLLRRSLARHRTLTALLSVVCVVGVIVGYQTNAAAALKLLFLPAILFAGIAWGELPSPTEQPRPLAAPTQEPKPPFRVEDLGAHIDQRRREEEAAKQAEIERRAQLQTLWAEVAQTVAAAVDLVNAQLSPHGMKLVLAKPRLFDDNECFGVECTLSHEPQPTERDYRDTQYIVVTTEGLNAGGKLLTFGGVSVEATASAIAEAVWRRI